MNASRTRAFQALEAILRHRRGLEDALAQPSRDIDPGAAAAPDLDERDRAFVRLLVATTLRRLGQIDDVLTAFLATPLPPRAHRAQDVLRLGAAQLLFLDTPAHAAVDTAVELARELGLAAHLKLVNALLRRVSREGRDRVAGQDAERLNTPDWLWESWSTAYGEAICRQIATAHLAEAPLDISVKGDPAAWAGPLAADLLPTGTLRRRPGGSVERLPGFEEGAWWVQDAAAALPARLFGPLAGRRIADLCAAPGGKTAQLAAAGAEVTALDRSAARLDRLKRNLSRLGLEARVETADAAVWRPERPFDGILLDAPCSATGTLRRHPDAASLKRPDDVGRLVAAQSRLLAAAIDMTAPGGLVIYCTCSLQPEEGAAAIDAAIRSGAPVRRVPITPSEVAGLAELVTPDGDLRCLPCHLAEKGGMDGFFAARLERQ
ncbi:MAG: MFS transporter [Telmatospirillum sp.]|nr:MFS transporter [Telmatospirillum sp.]